MTPCMYKSGRGKRASKTMRGFQDGPRWNPMQRARQNSRQQDIWESRALLLELVTSEPTIQQCFKVIESTCLSQGLHCRLDGSEVSEKFQTHLDDFWVPFCKESIRAFFTYGFVPWRSRRISRGDEVPEVIPAGTFGWHTEIGPVDQARQTNTLKKWQRFTDDETRMVVYRCVVCVFFRLL